MWERVGILRSRESLERAISEFDQIAASRLSLASRNFVTLAILVARAALWREESRGGHYRTDFTESSDRFQLHSMQRLDAEILGTRQINFTAGVGV